MAIRVAGRHDTLLIAGFAFALLVIFQPAIQHALDAARDIERTYGLSLVPALLILTVMFVFHQQANRREMRAETAAAALEASLARSRAQELEQLMLFGRALSAALTVDGMREAICRYLPALARDDRAWVMLRADGVWARIVDTGGLISPRGELERIAETAAAAAGEGINAMNGTIVEGHACFAIQARHEVVGILGLPADAARDDVRGAMAAAASLLAIAARNAQLFAELRDTSLKDSLTGCFNRAHAIETIDAELARARRSGAPLSIVMFDVDEFKQLNDGHGHLMGDTVLAHVGATLHRVLRRSDMRCRYGGDEFLVMLPDTDADGAREVAECLRREIREHAGRAAKAKVTISAGVATSVDGLGVAASLIDRADAALYTAKAAGRDCVRVTPPSVTPRALRAVPALADAGRDRFVPRLTTVGAEA